MTFIRGLTLVSASAVALSAAACATPGAQRRADDWRRILANEAPTGAPAEAAEAALTQRGVEVSRGTYVVVGDDGREHSNCPNPKTAVTGRETAGHVGFNTSVLEITACLDDAGHIERHYVGIWVQ